uniref:Ig-like domain-containing protein n=1 Tax=Ursus americanus TaxID=9643 RepID=A0A452SW68_URSAM
VLSTLLLSSAKGEEDPGFELRVQDSVTVQEGLCVHVPCSFSYPRAGGNNSTPTYGAWFQTKDNPKTDVLVATNNPAKGTKRKTRFPFHLLGDPGAGNCSLSITDAQRRHGGNYYFLLDRGLMRHSYKRNRNGPFATPDIRVKEPLESGCPSHLTCSVPGACDKATPLTISWTGAALRAPGLDLEASNSSEILLTPRLQDHGTNLTCRVTFPRAGVNTERTITLNVSCASDPIHHCLSVPDAPQNLSIGISRRNCTELKHLGNGSSLPVLEGESLLLVCAADSNPPATLSWAQGSRTLGPSQPWKPGFLELPRVELGHESRFTCQAQNSLGSQHVSLHLSVVCECGDPWGRGCLGLGRRGTTDPSPPSHRPPATKRSVSRFAGYLPAPIILTGPPSFPSIQGYQHEYPLGTPLACLPPALAAPTLEEEQDLHYASLTFHGLRPWKPQDLKGPSTTEYSEIKICKR